MTTTIEREEEYKEELSRSFDLVKPISVEAAAIFYPTLWEINPATKPLFKDTDMVKQGEKLMKVLEVAVGSLRNFKALKPILQTLGRKHVSYGVTAEMYPSVAEALLITLEKGLGDECTAETKAAWQWVLTVISGVCIEAAVEIDPTYADAKTSDDADAAGTKENGAEHAEGEGEGEGEEAPKSVVGVPVTTTTMTQEGQKSVGATGEEGPKDGKAVEEPPADTEATGAVVPERSDD